MNPSTQSLYITARDETRIAIDVYLSALQPQQRAPTALQTTRYHRSSADFTAFIGLGCVWFGSRWCFS